MRVVDFVECLVIMMLFSSVFYCVLVCVVIEVVVGVEFDYDVCCGCVVVVECEWIVSYLNWLVEFGF